MLAKLEPEPFNDPQYLWEIKYDGIRIITRTQQGSYLLQARSGTNKTRLFPELNLETKVPAILDGELVCYSEGKPTFNNIQHRANRVKDIEVISLQYPATFEVFDILMADGQDLQKFPLEERKEILESTLIPTNNVRVAPYIKGNGIELFESIIDRKMEGIIGKLITGTYQQGKRKWIKIKTNKLDEFIICGYTKGTGWRASTFGALILGKPTNNKLTYVGSVGTGFDEVEINRLYQKMLSLKQPICPFDEEPEEAVWIKPVISCMVQYLEVTGDGRLRFPSYKE